VGDFALVKLLLAEGCSAATVASDGQTPLMLAQELCDKRLCALLLNDHTHQPTTIDLDVTGPDKVTTAQDSDLSAGDISPGKLFRHTSVRPAM